MVETVFCPKEHHSVDGMAGLVSPGVIQITKLDSWRVRQTVTPTAPVHALKTFRQAFWSERSGYLQMLHCLRAVCVVPRGPKWRRMRNVVSPEHIHQPGISQSGGSNCENTCRSLIEHRPATRKGIGTSVTEHTRPWRG